MDMKEFNESTPVKFLIVLGKMYSSVFDKLDKHVKELKVNKTEFLILYAIASNGKLTIQDIGDRIFMTSGNMTYTIDKLEKSGYLERIRCQEDRRKIYIDFTPYGHKFWDSIMEPHMAYLNELFLNIDPVVLSETIDYMKIIGKNLN